MSLQTKMKFMGKSIKLESLHSSCIIYPQQWHGLSCEGTFRKLGSIFNRDIIRDIDVYFVNYRENFDFARQRKMIQPVEADFVFVPPELEKNDSNRSKHSKPLITRTVQYTNRPDEFSMRWFLINLGLREDTTNAVKNKLNKMNFFENE